MPEPSQTALAPEQRISAPAVPPPVPSRHAEPRPVRRSPLSYLLPVRLAQIVVWQVAALAALAWLRPMGPRSITVLAVGGFAVLCTSIRIRGLCAYEWLGVAVTHYRRRRAESGSDALWDVLPVLDIRSHVDRAGNRIGIAGVEDGWSAMIRLNTRAEVDPAGLVRILDEFYRSDEVGLAAAQLVVWIGAGSADSGAMPTRVYWLAIRYRPQASPQASRARGGGEIGELRATASAAFRLARRLDDAGHPCSVLDEEGLRDQLRTAIAAAGATAETWRSWSTDTTRQSCYRPSYRADPAAALGRWSSESAFICSSYLLHRRPRGQVRGRVTVRVAVPADPADPADSAPHERPTDPSVADALAIPLDPLDGRHRMSVRATLPLAVQ